MTTKPTILIVDDQPNNVYLLKRILGETCDTVVAHGGNEAIQHIEQTPFDLVLLDIMMPDISGLAVLEWIRKQWDISQLPVILISALSETEDVRRGLSMGANDYISKPLDIEVVQARIETQVKLKQLTDIHNQTIQALEHANAMRNRLMRIASHDLKNPLNNLGMVLTLLQDEPDSSNNANLLDMAHQSIDRMLSIIIEFLDLDILREDTIDIDLQPVHVADILTQITETYHYAADKKDIQLHISVDDVIITADPKRLDQVLSNVVSNAIKYSPYHSDIRIFSKMDADCVKIHVVDQGEGIPEDEQPMLFQPFSKISTQPTGGENSTGLGLWIAKQMMVMQGGDIGLDSPPQGGCDFWLQLPLAQEALAAQAV